jgi:signal transduction histidine kinase
VSASAVQELELDDAIVFAPASRERTREPAWPTAERLSLARELHDVVSYAIAAINLQAGVGLTVLADAPEQAAESLQAIRITSKDALHELRALLAGLLDEERAGERAEASLTSRLEALAATATGTGIPTRFQIFGPPRPVSAQSRHALYRIAQESLTNVLRHSNATCAEISLSFEQTGVLVEIVDDGVGYTDEGKSPGSGIGIAGMRGRVESLGGCLEASCRDVLGFRVWAWLPEPGRA